MSEYTLSRRSVDRSMVAGRCPLCGGMLLDAKAKKVLGKGGDLTLGGCCPPCGLRVRVEKSRREVRLWVSYDLPYRAFVSRRKGVLGDLSVELVGVREVADRCGVVQSTVSQWFRRGKMPAPAAHLEAGPVWLWSGVLDWWVEREDRALLRLHPRWTARLKMPVFDDPGDEREVSGG